MPFLQVNIMEGRSEERKTELIRRLTETVSEVLEAPPERIRVLINEVKKEHWGIGGKTAKELGR